MWWFISQHFGMRGRQEHHDIKMEDFIFEKDEKGLEYVTFSEGITKNHAGGLNHKPRIIQPKMFATENDCCSVKLLNVFKSKRPRELRDVGPFYLAVIDKPKDDGTWYKKSPMFTQSTIL